MSKRTIRCIVACVNSSGAPDFFACTIDCSSQQYNNGDHYDMVEAVVVNNDYEEPLVVYDENDGPAWLFERFDQLISEQRDIDRAKDDATEG